MCLRKTGTFKKKLALLKMATLGCSPNHLAKRKKHVIDTVDTVLHVSTRKFLDILTTTIIFNWYFLFIQSYVII